MYTDETTIQENSEENLCVMLVYVSALKTPAVHDGPEKVVRVCCTFSGRGVPRRRHPLPLPE